MKLGISGEATTWAVFVSITARGCVALMLEAPAGLHNGAWLSALIGAVPVMLWLKWLESIATGDSSRHRLLIKLMSPVLLAVTLMDGGIVLSTLVRSAAYLALDRRQTAMQALPLCLAVFCCAAHNGDSRRLCGKTGRENPSPPLIARCAAPVSPFQARLAVSSVGEWRGRHPGRRSTHGRQGDPCGLGAAASGKRRK